MKHADHTDNMAARARPGTAKRVSARVMATFHPQAWVGDYAIEVDAEGPVAWDVTEEILRMPRARALALEDDQYETDELRGSQNAPKWIREWRGPFYISVEGSVRNFFGVPASEGLP